MLTRFVGANGSFSEPFRALTRMRRAVCRFDPCFDHNLLLNETQAVLIFLKSRERFFSIHHDLLKIFMKYCENLFFNTFRYLFFCFCVLFFKHGDNLLMISKRTN